MSSPRADGPLVTVVGEALIDLVATEPGTYAARPGGSPYNVAIGLSRLGIRTSLMARLADDAFGRQLRAHAVGEGVDVSACAAATEPTTLAVVTLDEHAQATYDFYTDGTADWQWTAAELDRLQPETAVLHLGSVASWTPPGCDAIHALAARFGGLVSYDPNVRPQLLGSAERGRELVERTVRVAHVVKASREDVTWLYPGDSLGAVAERWHELGALLVVVTDGANGAHGFRSGTPGRHRPGRAVDVVDTVGAGDSFTAGLLACLASTAPAEIAALDAGLLDRYVDRAIGVSALTCTRRSGSAYRRPAGYAAVVTLLDAAAAVLRDLDGRHEDVVERAAAERQWWVEQWPDGEPFLLCLLAQDVQEAVNELDPLWPLCEEHRDHRLVVEPDLGPDPFWVCERTGLPVAPVGSLR